jgi:hypothetical protein
VSEEPGEPQVPRHERAQSGLHGVRAAIERECTSVSSKRGSQSSIRRSIS